MAVLTVGTGQQFATIAAAVNAAQSGDTVQVLAGTYTDDFLSIDKSLTLQAVGGVVKMLATVAPPNGKAIITEGVPGISVTINGFEISGSQVADGNGAAVRYEGGNLTLNNVYFHNNQDGLLAGVDPNGTITINNSEFAFNGAGDGLTHNLYVNQIATLNINGSYFHDADVGHEIKSRAANTIITNSRIFDNQATASYSVDLPNGGNATIRNSVIQQGPNSENPNIIAYGEEGTLNPGTSVLIADNTIINDLTSGSQQLVLNGTSTALVLQNNNIWGLAAAQLGGPLVDSSTSLLTTRPTLNTAATWDVGLQLCFLAGAGIATPTHEARVEELAVGDQVLTVDGNIKRIVWIGVGRVLAIPGRRNPTTPVIVRKGALSDNVPHRDLHVTKGHSLFIDEVLIPVESLVNGRSIVWDDQAQEAEVYHVELSRHDVLIANGAPAESYRDDGNRCLFRNAVSRRGLLPDEPYAPVLTDGPIVDAVWQRILNRAGGPARIPTTVDPDLHLIVDSRRIDGRRRPYGAHLFHLPTHLGEVRIVSRSGAPSELGLARDPRLLGVALRRVMLWQGPRVRVVEASDPLLCDGFHNFEVTNGFRWTNGDGLLPPELFADITGPCELELRIVCAALYPFSSSTRANDTWCKELNKDNTTAEPVHQVLGSSQINAVASEMA